MLFSMIINTSMLNMIHYLVSFIFIIEWFTIYMSISFQYNLLCKVQWWDVWNRVLNVIIRVLYSSHLKGYCSVHTDEKSHDVTDAVAIAFHTAVSCGKCVLKGAG